MAKGNLEYRIRQAEKRLRQAKKWGTNARVKRKRLALEKLQEALTKRDAGKVGQV